MPKDSRARMVRSAAALIRSRGVNATSFSDVVAESGAPRGSIYHHFPKGKGQLADEAIGWTSARVLAYLAAGSPSSPSEVLGRFIDLWRQTVVASGGKAGCAVAGVAIDTWDDGGRLDLVRSTFRSWVSALAEQLVSVGLPPGRATAIATAALASMEGALILCRAERDVGPLNTVADELMRLVSPGGGGPPREKTSARAENVPREHAPAHADKPRARRGDQKEAPEPKR